MNTNLGKTKFENSTKNYHLNFRAKNYISVFASKTNFRGKNDHLNFRAQNCQNLFDR